MTTPSLRVLTPHQSVQGIAFCHGKSGCTQAGVVKLGVKPTIVVPLGHAITQAS
jgi:hypothetical protein